MAPGVNGRQRRRRPQHAAAIKIGQWTQRRRPWNVEIQTVQNCSPCWHHAAKNLKNLKKIRLLLFDTSTRFILSLNKCLQLCISKSAVQKFQFLSIRHASSLIGNTCITREKRLRESLIGKLFYFLRMQHHQRSTQRDLHFSTLSPRSIGNSNAGCYSARPIAFGGAAMEAGRLTRWSSKHQRRIREKFAGAG